MKATIAGPFCCLNWSICEVCQKRYVRPPDHDGHGCSTKCREVLTQTRTLKQRTCAYRNCHAPFTVPAMSRQCYCNDLCRAREAVARYEDSIKGLRNFKRPRRALRYESDVEMRLAHIQATRAARSRRVGSTPVLPGSKQAVEVRRLLTQDERDAAWAVLAAERREAEARRNAFLAIRFGAARAGA